MHKNGNYLNFIDNLDNLLACDDYEISVLANTTALIKSSIRDISWVGFYILNDSNLLLGPFQGKIACTKIALGKGVCGLSALKRETILVPNVHEFPGHIACDSASNSEIVIPIFLNEKIYGVLDLDSKRFNRFGDYEKELFEEVASIISKHLTRIKTI